MGYVNVFLSKPCKVSVKNRQLVVQSEEEHTFPIEDMNALLMETGECTVTATALRALADEGVAVFLCDEKHLPNGVLLPYKTYYRPLKILNLQLSIAKPLQKRLWQSIVKRKIQNQATCLALCGKEEEARYLFDLSRNVASDDAKNLEAVAANFYFKNLFGDDFTRQDDRFENAALNYGYSLVRGLLARTLSVYGFESSIGLHHGNQLNNFNLADDLIEPYRPVVDLMVKELPVEKELTPAAKRILFTLFNRDVDINGQKYSLSYAVDLTVQSLRVSLENETVELVLPELMPLRAHRYE